MAIQAPQDHMDSGFDQLGQAVFDPVRFLNDTLPPLNLSSQGSSGKQTRSAVLQIISSEIQSNLSKLNTHSIRSSSELTTLTDEILRSGNRLAYEVEVLRGNVNGLYELLTESLKDEISRFVLNEMTQESTDVDAAAAVVDELSMDRTTTTTTTAIQDPDFIKQLRILGTVKSRLEAVIQAFGEALKWPIPPSEVSMSSTMISVSAPELGMMSTAEDDKAHAYTRRLRDEIIEALESDGGGMAGLEAATRKVNNLRALSQIWKGTAEERARTKVVDNLAKLVEDRRKALDARAAQARTSAEGSVPRSSSMPGRAGRIVEGSSNTAAGLFRNLQKLRDEIYQD